MIFKMCRIYKKINADLFLHEPMFAYQMQVFRIIRWIQPCFALEKDLVFDGRGLIMRF